MFPQIMLYAVTLFLFVASAVAPSRAERQDDDKRPTQSSLMAIAAWVSANTDFPMVKELPAVELVAAPELKRLRDKGLTSFYFSGGPAAG